MSDLKVKLFFARIGNDDDVVEVSITTTKDRINDDVGIVMQAMAERGYYCYKGVLEEERGNDGVR